MNLSVSSPAASALAALQALSLQAGASGSSQTAATIPAAASPFDASATSISAATASAGSSLYALVEGAGQATTAADAAGAAGSTVLDLLQQLRQTAAHAADPSLSSADRQALDAGFRQAAGQIDPTLAAATVNGANLVDGSQASSLKVALGDGSVASLTPLNLTLGGPILGFGAETSVATATAAASAFATLGEAIGAAGSALGTLGGQAAQITAHVGFVQNYSQALASPSDDGGDSVRLLALQLSQQLSTQTTAVANAAPQSILSLFRS